MTLTRGPVGPMAPVGPDSPWEKKLNDRFREMDERKIESHLTSVLVLDLRGRFAQVPVCITHGKDTIPHADGNTMFTCSQCLWFSAKTAAVVASTESEW